MQNLTDMFASADVIGWLETVFRLFLAILGGAVLGWERERRQKPAGLRTHMMVALGSATLMLVTLEFAAEFAGDSDVVRIDPLRTLAGIVGGIGFLGAGTIIQSRGSVQGITTAASIWVVAAIGVASGMGMYQISFTTVLLAIVVLQVVGFFEYKAFDLKSDEKSADENS